MLQRALACAATVGLAGTALLAGFDGRAPQAASDPEGIANALTFRNIGPFRTGAWVTEIAVPDQPARDHRYTIYAATRSGGLWKSVNAGTTWDVISDSVGVAAVGAVAVAPSDPNVVWMGTGANDIARSSYSGRGVFKSMDGGRTWHPMGLPDSHHIARIVIHPGNPEIVFVAAIGHLFSRNEERGVFRTADGGRTWQKVLYVNDGVGAIDLALDRRTPATLYAAMYEKDRNAWRLILGGAGSAVYKSVDTGLKWARLEGGLPSGTIGRIGLDVYQRSPNTVYAIVENLNPRAQGVAAATDACVAAPAGGRGRIGGGAGAPGPGRGAAGGGPYGNEVYRSDDAGRTWRKTHGDDIDVGGGKAPYSFNQIKINPHNPDHVIVTSDQMYVSTDGGRTWSCSNYNGFFRSVFGDFRSMWWDPDDEQRIMLGSDGGVNISYDGGRTADYALNMRVGEVYFVGTDMDDPYHVYAGLQDHDSWKGPSNSPTGRITLDQWTTVGPGDGMYNQVDPTDSRWVYNTREMGNHGRFDQVTGQRTVIAPPQPPGAPPLRYIWQTPIVLSPHNPQVVYAGAQLLMRSPNRGDRWEVLSGDLTTNDASRCGRNSGNVPYCAITTISESPVQPGVIWIGTDDGKVQVTTDHGASWTDVTPRLAARGAPADRYVSRVFASPHAAGTAFVAKNGFRHDDFTPYLFRTTDHGRTWSSVAAGLPASPINVVVQDRRHPGLLVVGHDAGVVFSIDEGSHWTPLVANLPPVAVHDLTIHPRENDLVLGTYGRGIWIGDIAPLQELTPDVLAKPLHLFDIEARARYGFGAIGNYRLYGDRYIEVPNEPEAFIVSFHAREAAASPARVTLTDITGRALRTATSGVRAGLNRVQIPLGAGGRAGGAGTAGPLAPGDYLVTLEAAGQTLTKIARVRDRLRR